MTIYNNIHFEKRFNYNNNRKITTTYIKKRSTTHFVIRRDERVGGARRTRVFVFLNRAPPWGYGEESFRIGSRSFTLCIIGALRMTRSADLESQWFLFRFRKTYLVRVACFAKLSNIHFNHRHFDVHRDIVLPGQFSNKTRNRSTGKIDDINDN